MTPMGFVDTKSQASIVIVKSFSSPLFLNAYVVGLHTKSIIELIVYPQHKIKSFAMGNHLQIMPNAISESLYFVIGHYICPKSALYFQHVNPILSPIF